MKKSVRKNSLSYLVYSYISKIPKGKIATYKSVAIGIGHPKTYRAVGSVLRKNEHPIEIPCYKVIKSDGHLGNYSGAGGTETKKRLLERDGIIVKEGKVIDFRRILFNIDIKRLPK